MFSHRFIIMHIFFWTFHQINAALYKMGWHIVNGRIVLYFGKWYRIYCKRGKSNVVSSDASTSLARFRIFHVVVFKSILKDNFLQKIIFLRLFITQVIMSLPSTATSNFETGSFSENVILKVFLSLYWVVIFIYQISLQPLNIVAVLHVHLKRCEKIKST